MFLKLKKMNQYLKSLYIFNNYKDKHFQIDFPPQKEQKFRHLILTGTNGSGKTTILKSLALKYILLKEKLINRSDNIINKKEQINDFEQVFDFNFPFIEFENTSEIQDNKNIFIYIPTIKYKHINEYNENIKLNFTEKIYSFRQNLLNNETIALVINFENLINKTIEFEKYKLAIKNNIEQNPYPKIKEIPRFSLSENFLQFLFLLKDEQAFSFLEDEPKKAKALTKRFSDIEKAFQILFEDSDLKLKHQFRGGRKFYFILGDGRKIDFNELSHGHNAVLSIVSEIMLNIEAHREKNIDDYNPKGVVVIDEIESHLHISLQEKILPILTQMFPNLQFIVATHSPAVIASISNATVYDLTLKRTVNENLTGIPYNVLMKSHFGIESEYSIEVTNKLNYVKTLVSKDTLNKKETTKLENLINELQELSPDLALDVQLEMDRRKRNAKL